MSPVTPCVHICLQSLLIPSHIMEQEGSSDFVDKNKLTYQVLTIRLENGNHFLVIFPVKIPTI